MSDKQRSFGVTAVGALVVGLIAFIAAGLAVGGALWPIMSLGFYPNPIPDHITPGEAFVGALAAGALVTGVFATPVAALHSCLSAGVFVVRGTRVSVILAAILLSAAVTFVVSPALYPLVQDTALILETNLHATFVPYTTEWLGGLIWHSDLWWAFPLYLLCIITFVIDVLIALFWALVDPQLWFNVVLTSLAAAPTMVIGYGSAIGFSAWRSRRAKTD